MQLLPQGTFRRRVFEAVDRALGHVFFGDPRTVSTHCGEQIVAGRPTKACECLCHLLDYIEKDHCKKNAGKK